MIALRTVLAFGMVVAGAILIVRVLALGLSFAIVPGFVLGAAVVALGLYRLKQLRALRDPR